MLEALLFGRPFLNKLEDAIQADSILLAFLKCQCVTKSWAQPGSWFNCMTNDQFKSTAVTVHPLNGVEGDPEACFKMFFFRFHQVNVSISYQHDLTVHPPLSLVIFLRVCQSQRLNFRSAMWLKTFSFICLSHLDSDNFPFITLSKMTLVLHTVWFDLPIQD